MRKLLGFLIAAVLVGAVAAALVKSDEEPLAGPTDLPPVPTVSDTPTAEETPTLTETPSLTPGVTDSPTAAGQTPSGQTTDTTEPSPSMSELPRTGDGSAAAPALLAILIAAGAGLAVHRTRSSRA